jgi:hypothetical protein
MTSSTPAQESSQRRAKGKPLPLAGRVALITGASGGIGQATARELARQGASVVLAARRVDALDALAQELEAEGAEALAAPTDLTDAAQIERRAERALDLRLRLPPRPQPHRVHSRHTRLRRSLLRPRQCQQQSTPVE